MWGIVKFLHGLATASRERYESLGRFLKGLRGQATLIGKSVFSWVGKDPQYGFGKGLRGNVSGGMKKGFSRSIRISDRVEREG